MAARSVSDIKYSPFSLWWSWRMVMQEQLYDVVRTAVTVSYVGATSRCFESSLVSDRERERGHQETTNNTAQQTSSVLVLNLDFFLKCNQKLHINCLYLSFLEKLFWLVASLLTLCTPAGSCPFFTGKSVACLELSLQGEPASSVSLCSPGPSGLNLLAFCCYITVDVH